LLTLVGERIARLVTIDEDINQTYTYRLLDDGDGLFQLQGDSLTATRTFDFETSDNSPFVIVVESVDQSKPDFKVNVLGIAYTYKT